MFQNVFCFVLLAFVMKNIGAITDEQKDQIKSHLTEIGKECFGEHPLTTEDIASFKNKEFPDGDNASCFVACVFNKAGLFDNNGTLSHATAVENAKQIFDDEDELKNLEEFLNTCAKVNDEDVSDEDSGCERAKLAYECLTENSEQFGYNFE